MAFDRLRFPSDYDRMPGETPCVLDTIVALDANLLALDNVDATVFPIGCTLRFGGWAVAPVLGGFRVPLAVLLHIGTTATYLSAKNGIAREDVGRDLGDARLSGAGFRGTQSVDEDVPLGRHGLSLAVVCEPETYFESPLRRSIEIVESRRLFPAVPESDRTTIAATSLQAMHVRSERPQSTRFSRGAILVARGEAIDRDSHLPASRVYAIVDDRAYYGGIAGVANERGERSAFSVRIPTRHLAPGEHTVRIAAIANDGTSFTYGQRESFVLRT